MFQFPWFAFLAAILFTARCLAFYQTGFPIRISTGLWLFAPHRSFSQLVTSFFGSWCQGIHPTLLLAWPWRNCIITISFFPCVVFKEQNTRTTTGRPSRCRMLDAGGRIKTFLTSRFSLLASIRVIRSAHSVFSFILHFFQSIRSAKL
jgi:hypothetical protein